MMIIMTLMKSKSWGRIKCIFCSVAPLLLIFSCMAGRQSSRQILFHSTSFTELNSFISPEGPAVDKNGLLYVVNYLHKGTIGQIMPDGQGKIFLTLPQGSIGNGIRFNRAGIMFIADYVHHNILKVEMTNGQL